MTQLSNIIAYLDDLLEVPDFPDDGPNGLQVPGREEVTTVATGVSAHRGCRSARPRRGPSS